MKKVIAITALSAALGSVGMAQADSGGTISFEGELTGSTCQVFLNGGGASGTVTLPTVDTSKLQAKGDVLGTTAFQLGVTNCTKDTKTTVSAFFESGPNVDPVNFWLKNTAGEGVAAENVALQLRYMDETGGSGAGASIKVGSSEQMADALFVDMPSDATVVPLNYAVEYVALSATTPGTVTSSVTYSLMYE